MSELSDFETAEAIRDNRLPSPTKFHESWMFDVRITGTGHAYRDSIEEWAIRDPVTWTSPEFVNRCNGLPVIFEHPERSGLNSEEFKERVIGTIRLPYVKNDEVWGIAQIYDADAAQLMQTTHISTSPGVTPPKGSEATELKDGTKVLAEGLPLILDHLAICELGVWDKDGPPEGIRLDRKGSVVTEEEKKALEKERDDAKVRADAAESKLKEMEDAAKKESEEKERADKARKDAEESDREALAKAAKEKADAAKRDARKSRHDKHDGDIMDCAKCDSEETEEKEKADKTKKDAAAQANIDADRLSEMHDSKLRAELDSTKSALASMQSQLEAISRPRSFEDSDAIAKAFHRADSLFQMLNEQTPQALPGENPIAYRKRLANRLRQFTDSWKEYAFHDAQQLQDFNLVEGRIYAEAEKHVTKAVEDKPGFLQEIVTTNSMGKRQSSFRGDARAAWLPFMPPTQRFITGFNRNPNASGSR